MKRKQIDTGVDEVFRNNEELAGEVFTDFEMVSVCRHGV